MTRIYLLRHAQSAPSRAIAEPDWPLSERGREQARAIVPLLQTLGIARIRSSPYLRAVDTVRPFARAAGLELEIEPRLRERNLANGFVEDFLALIERSWQDPDFRLPDSESARECQSRVLEAVSECLAGTEIALLSSHGNAIGFYLRAIDPLFDFQQWRAMANPDLFCIDRDGEAARWQRVALA